MTGKAENTGSENFSGMPLYRRAALQLQELIVRDGLQPGDRLPSSRELQKRFGVSLVTIEAGMKLLVESGVLSRRPRLGTFVANGSAGAPPAAARRRLRIVFSGILPRDLYWSRVLTTLCTLPELAMFEKSLDVVNGAMPELVPAPEAGMILCGYTAPELVRRLRQEKIPFVMIGSFNVPDQPEFPFDAVVHDDVERSYLATRHLLELGHRAVFCIVGPSGSRLAEDFQNGYRRAMTEYNVSDRPCHLELAERHTVELGEQIGVRMLTRVPRPTAVFCCDDRLAIGVGKAAQRLGFRIPEDLSLIGCGSLEVGQLMTPELTTIPSEPEESARLAAHKLNCQLAGGGYEPSVTVLHRKQLHIGGSTRLWREPEAPYQKKRMETELFIPELSHR